MKPLLNPEDQRRIARIYLSVFLEATLHGRREYLPLFRDYRSIGSWLPDTLYVNRYQDAGYQAVADFNEDPDVSTTTLPGGRIEGADLSDAVRGYPKKSAANYTNLPDHTEGIQESFIGFV